MNQSLVLVLWVVIAWGLFAFFAGSAELYDRAAWRLPEGAENANLPRRLRVAIVLGGGACLICVAAVVLRTDKPLLMACLVAQGALMAAAGVTDLHKYRLPLPVTVGGIALALAAAAIAGVPFEVLTLGALWSCVLVVAHACMTRGKMGLGDHLATVWIGLAAPLVGVLAILVGHIVTLLCAKLTGWGHRPVPIGGAWLLACTMLFALPNTLYDGAFALQTQTSAPAAALEIQPAGRDATALVRRRVLRDVLREAGFLTAKVAFENDRAGREREARAAAKRIAELGQLAAWSDDPGNQHGARLLNDLARALDCYDLAGIDALSRQRAELLDVLAVGLEQRLSVGRDVVHP